MNNPRRRPVATPPDFTFMSRRRLALLAIACLGVGGALIWRMVDLQVTRSESHVRRAERQQTGTLTARGKRGRILDSNGREMAVSLDADSIYARIEDLPKEDRRGLERTLAQRLGLPEKELRRKLDRPSGFVWLARKVDPGAAQAARALDIPGIGFVKESQRYYPGRTMAGHLLGFVGMDDAGMEGIERRYDSELAGREYALSFLHDVRGRAVLSDTHPFDIDLDGRDAILTIDMRLQHFAESVLERAVRDTQSRGGAILVQDPVRGAIFASAVQPAFNPNAYRVSDAAGRRNRAVTDGHEPGSTLKPFLMAAALEHGGLSESDRFFCENGHYRVHNKVLRDVKANGDLTLEDILKFSSNIGSAKIAERMGALPYYRTLRAFGFGERTGSDLEGEIAGRLTHSRNWYPVDLANHAFGQGMLTTALQMASAYSALANGGLRMRPYVLGSVLERGVPVRVQEPQVLGRAVSEETARRVMRMMVRVTEPDGTGAKAALEGYAVAGKTGTAQKFDPALGEYVAGRFLSSFIGIVPADRPRLTIVVMLDEPSGGAYYGGAVSAPAFREVAEKALNVLGIPPSRESAMDRWNAVLDAMPAATAAPIGLGNLTAEKEERVIVMPDLQGKGLKEVVEIGRRLPLPLRIEGAGRVESQSPAPGTPLGPAMQAAVRLAWPQL